MYNLNDTIVAVSTATSDNCVLVRITGSKTLDVCRQFFSPDIPENNAGIFSGTVKVDSQLEIDAKLYLFLSPHSYTGEDVAEIHINTNSSVTEALMQHLFKKKLRMAGPGEFTARSFFNGKIDLAQAEAVNEIITTSNKYQLEIAEKLLAGRLAQTTEKIRSSIMDSLSFIEAGLDFSQEDIEFITRQQGFEMLTEINNQLQQLLSNRISYESVIDLPSVGIAGATNAGKSSLLNKLLGKERSIVSEQRKTTRDVLTALLKLNHCKCVLFDCAGLLPETETILDHLAQQAAVESLNNANLVVFCVDISKAGWAEDIQIYKLIKPHSLIAVVTKTDLLDSENLPEKIVVLEKLFTVDFLAVSSKTGLGIKQLRKIIDRKIVELTLSSTKPDQVPFSENVEGAAALTARHKQAVTEAIGNITEAVDHFKSGNDELTAMMLRSAYQSICDIEQQSVDEQILNRIFSRFCIGK